MMKMPGRWGSERYLSSTMGGSARMDAVCPFAHAAKEDMVGMREPVPKLRAVRIELTTLGLWDLRATDCAKLACGKQYMLPFRISLKRKWASFRQQVACGWVKDSNQRGSATCKLDL